jgi:hypothetical protein
MLWLLYILARYIENLFYYILIDEYTPEHTIMITTEILLRFFLVLVLTALLSDVQTARLRTRLKTHARHSPS